MCFIDDNIFPLFEIPYMVFTLLCFVVRVLVPYPELGSANQNLVPGTGIWFREPEHRYRDRNMVLCHGSENQILYFGSSPNRALSKHPPTIILIMVHYNVVEHYKLY